MSKVKVTEEMIQECFSCCQLAEEDVNVERILEILHNTIKIKEIEKDAIC